MNSNSPTDKLYSRLFRYDDRGNRKDSDGDWLIYAVLSG